MVDSPPRKCRNVREDNCKDQTPAVDETPAEPQAEVPAKETSSAPASTVIAAASVDAKPTARASFLKGLWDDSLYQRSVDFVIKLNVSTGIPVNMAAT